MARQPPSLATLARLAKAVGKSKPEKAHAPVFEAFEIAALAGDVKSARRLLGAMLALPPAKRVVHALSTHAIDVFCDAAGFGDLTKGQPTHQWALVQGGTLAERVAAIDRGVRYRVAMNAYGDDKDLPKDDAWRKRKRSDPRYVIERYQRIQALVHPDLATPETEREALVRVEELMGDWPADTRGAGYGNELVIALDLALRHGAEDKAAAWLAAQGKRVADESLAVTLLCFPSLARAMVRGFFRPLEAASPKDLERALSEVAAAAEALAKATPAPPPNEKAKTPKVQKRRVGCEYSQLHIEPAEPTAEELAQVFFQERGESEQGMSIFPTKVGIGTPTDTELVDAAVRFDLAGPAGKPDLGRAVQAVAFPLEVRGALRLRSVTEGDDDGEPLDVPPGSYDVLAAFFAPAKAPKRKSALRRFALALTFRPKGALGAPKCFRLEDGSKPPAKIVLGGG